MKKVLHEKEAFISSLAQNKKNLKKKKKRRRKNLSMLQIRHSVKTRKRTKSTYDNKEYLNAA